jgi:hypothetical protein
MKRWCSASTIIGTIGGPDKLAGEVLGVGRNAGVAVHSRHSATELCNEKVQFVQWPRFVANILNFASRAGKAHAEQPDAGGRCVSVSKGRTSCIHEADFTRRRNEVARFMTTGYRNRIQTGVVGNDRLFVL